MSKKLILALGAASLAFASNAQQLKADYIEWPNSANLHNYVKDWVPGTPLFEDENFFIARVPLKPLISRNTVTQVYESINDDNDKDLCFWVPVGNSNINGAHTDGLPNAAYDSEVFSMWSYVTHYGDWISPYGWSPAAFTDAAHKNGTLVSGVASVPNATISAGWSTCFTQLAAQDVEKVGKFLLYHGVDGLSYNSEWYGGSGFQSSLNSFHGRLGKYMKDKTPAFENIWYGGTGDNGSCSFDDMLSSGKMGTFGTSAEPRSRLFLNYNWNFDSKINTSTSNCATAGRPMRDLYAGMNMQGGCKSADEWVRHTKIGYSIGLWGAHDFNYLWSPRAQNGSSPLMKQQTYQKLVEWWYTNGKRNPIAKMPVVNRGTLASAPDFFGISRFMSERSALGWDIANEPFISYFNLGNGTFLNWKGERMHNTEWYNLGVQDYMPTWRFWFANSFLGKEPENMIENGLDAEFTWEDAYMGGSCLRVHGTVADEYLHLFKTDYVLNTNDVITVRYKLMGGSADIKLALAVDDSPAQVAENYLSVMKSDLEADDEVWVEKKFTIKTQLQSALRGKHISVIGLHIQNANNLNLYLGEISFKKGSATATPAKPNITLAKTFCYNYKGVDGKIIWNMTNSKAAGEPVYNLDVNTSLFRVWSQQEGEDPVLNCLTSSWAAIAFQAPMNSEGAKKIRFGVSAVSSDFASESDIAWSNYLNTGDYTTVDLISCSKGTIKPDEEFTLTYVDPLRPAGNWKIINPDNGNVVFEKSGHDVTTKISEIGAYHVEVDGVRYNYYLSVTGWDKGALPEITGLTVNSETAGTSNVEILTDQEFVLGYTGRGADGMSSQGITNQNKFAGFKIDDVGVSAQQKSFGVGIWAKFDEKPFNGSRVFGIENRTLSWPINNWGWVWGNATSEHGAFDMVFRTSTAGGSREVKYRYGDVINLNAWTHIAFSFEWNNGSFRLRTFINGLEVLPEQVLNRYDNGTTTYPKDAEELWANTSNYTIPTGYWATWSGGAGSEPVYNNAVLDDMVVWDGAITETDAMKAVEGLKEDALPSNVIAFWNFEKRIDGAAFSSVGTKAGVQGSAFALLAADGEGQATPTFIMPEYRTGCTSIDGTGFNVETKPTWTLRRSLITEQAGNDREGSAKIKMTRSGDYTCTLTLENGLGSDSREYPVISASDNKGALEGVTENEFRTYVMDEAIMIDFANDGEYTVAVYDVAGHMVANRTAHMNSGSVMAVSVRNAGVYLVKVMTGGRDLRTVKVIKN